jgi:hypothetical protein
MRVLNFAVTAAYTVGVPYGTVAYWGWQAMGLGQVMAQQGDSIAAIVKNVLSTCVRQEHKEEAAT